MTETTIHDLLTEDQVATLLGVKKGTLAVWRCGSNKRKRCDLAYIKVGKCVRYRLADVQKFIDANTVSGGQS